MDNLAGKVKDAFDQSLPQEACFTEDEKQKIRNRIRNLQPRQPKRRLELVPKTLTAILAAGFLLFVGGIFGQQLGFNSSQTNNSKENSAQQKSDHTNDFYANVNLGDKVNGWKLISKQDFEEIKRYTFDGNAVLRGGLAFTNENDLLFPNRIIFVPEEDSLKLLPLKGDKVKVILDFSNQSSVEEIFNIKPGDMLDHVSIEIDQYAVNIKNGEEIPDTVHFIKTDITKTTVDLALTLDANNQLVLPQALQAAYDTFSKTHDDQALKDLTPFDIFQLYFYAEEQADYKTQYAMFIDDPEYEKIFKTEGEYIAASTEPNNRPGKKDLIEKIRKSSPEMHIIGDSAYISISKENGLSFGLTKNKKGIWKVNWLPLQ